MQQEDYLVWLDTCNTINSSRGALGELSKVVDFSKVNPEFKNLGIYRSDLAYSFNLYRIYHYNDKPEDRVTFSDRLEHSVVIYIKEKRMSKTLIRYMKEKYPNQNIWFFRPKTSNKLMEPGVLGYFDKRKPFACQQTLIDALLDSNYVINGDEFEIPQEWLDMKEEEIKQEEEREKYASLSNKERRALEDRTVIYQYRWCNKSLYNLPKDKGFIGTKKEPKVKDLLEYGGYYGSREDEEKLHFAAYFIFCVSKGRQSHLDSTDNGIFLISKSNFKHVRGNENLRHINDFFSYNENGVIKMDERIVDWYTGRKIEDLLHKVNFLGNFSKVNQEKANVYYRLYKFMKDNKIGDHRYDRMYGANGLLDDFRTFMDKIYEFQTFVAEDPDNTEGIADFAKKKSIPGMTNVFAAKLEIIEEAQELVNYGESVATILNPLLDKTGPLLNEEMIQAIEEYLELKNVK